MTGLEIRMNSIFSKKDGRAVIVAADHGSIAGPIDGIVKPADLVKSCVEAKADAILTTKGFADAASKEWDKTTGLILRITGGFTVLGGGFEEELITTPETAASYGACCAAMTVKFGHKREGDFIRQASLAADRCHELGLPVMIEAMAKGTLKGAAFPSNDAEAIKMAARMAAEIGADMVKTYYTGSIESFEKVVNSCPVPVVILGGAKTEGTKELFECIYDSLQAGGKGIAIGRNIFGYPEINKMLLAVNGLVHENWTVEQALSVI